MSEAKIPTGELMKAFDRYSQQFRGVRPRFVRFKDGKLIKYALTYLNPSQIEMLFVWFLKVKKEMSPAIGAALCKEVISDFISASQQEYGFYAKIASSMHSGDSYKIPAKTIEEEQIRKAFKKLKTSFERNAIKPDALE